VSTKSKKPQDSCFARPATVKNDVALAFDPATLAGAFARLKKIFRFVGFKLPVVASREVGRA